MCGIFAYIGKRKDAKEIVLSGLKRLEYRGYDSWGVAVAGENGIAVKKRTGKIGQANVADLPDGDFAFGHTRWATHGGVTEENSHPHLDCSATLAVIHNGIIENYEEIKLFLEKKGHKFVSETDTEIFAHLVEEYRKKFPLPESVRLAFLRAEGLNAMIVMDSVAGEFVAVRNGSPLVVGLGRGENYLASDPAALLANTRSVYYLEDGQLARVTRNGFDVSEITTGKKLSVSPVTLNWKQSLAEKGKYPHFMLKEIYEQPRVISEIARDSRGTAEKIAAVIRYSFGAYLLGCGTASYACLAGSYLFSKIAKRHINWAVGSEFSYQLDFLTPKSLVMALSQSGETMDILEAVKNSREKGAKIFSLVNVLGSTLYRISDYKMLIGAGPEKAVASTKAFTGKLAHLVLLAYSVAGFPEKGIEILSRAVVSSKKVLAPKNAQKIRELASKIRETKHIYIVGRGLSYPASLEAALKIKEISYIHAEGFAAGELKHGVIALIEKGTPCIVFLPDDETFGANLAGAMELKARGGYIIGISPRPHEIFDYFLPVEDAGEATIIPNVITAQLLAYFLTLEKGLDPDMPRNLAKSVTVK